MKEITNSSLIHSLEPGAEPGFSVGRGTEHPEMEPPTYDFAKFPKKLRQIENIIGRRGCRDIPSLYLPMWTAMNPVGLEMLYCARCALTRLTNYRSAQSRIDHCAHIDLFILGWKDEETKHDQVVIEPQRKTNHPETVANKPTDFCATCLRDNSKRTNLINVGGHEIWTEVLRARYVSKRPGK